MLPVSIFPAMKPSNRTTSPKPVSSTINLAIAFLLLAALAVLWTSRTRTRDRLEQLSVEKNQLEQQLADARRQIEDFNSGDSSAQTRERLAAARKTRVAEPVQEEIETLFLQPPTVEKTADGLTVRLGFQPGENVELPPSMTLVVRIPDGSSAKIISLKTVGADDRPDVSYVVNSTGTLGLIDGLPLGQGAPSFELTVTAPVKATIRGSKGVADFELDIADGECTVRKL